MYFINIKFHFRLKKKVNKINMIIFQGKLVIGAVENRKRINKNKLFCFFKHTIFFSKQLKNFMRLIILCIKFFKEYLFHYNMYIKYTEVY